MNKEVEKVLWCLIDEIWNSGNPSERTIYLLGEYEDECAFVKDFLERFDESKDTREIKLMDKSATMNKGVRVIDSEGVIGTILDDYDGTNMHDIQWDNCNNQSICKCVSEYNIYKGD